MSVCDTQRVKRFAGLLLLLIAVAVAAGVTYAIRERRTFAKSWALALVEGWGLAPVTFDVTEFGPQGARLEGLEVGAPASLRIERLDFTWSPTEIAQLRIAQLALTGVRLDAAIDENGEISLGALDAFFEGEAEGDGDPVLPVEVTLTDARVDLATPLGNVALVALEGTLAPDIRGFATGMLAAELRDAAESERFLPVQFSVRAEPAQSDLNLSFSADTAEGHIRVSGNGSFSPEAGTGTLAVTLDPITFGPGGVQIGEIAPRLPKPVPTVEGKLGGRAEIRLDLDSSDPATLAGTLDFGELSAQREDSRLEGLTGTLQFAGPTPWRTRGMQKLEFALLDFVGAIQGGEVHFESRGTDVRLESFRGRWAEGRIETSGAFDPVNQSGGLAVQLIDLDLALVLETLDIEDLAGTGRISGAVPIVLEGESLQVGAALAASADGGVIHWQPASGAAKRLGLTGDLAVVADALEDYHYEELQIGLEGDLAGDVRMRLSLKGNNPAYEAGRPVHLNLQVETNVPAMLLTSRAASRMPEALERRLRERARR